MNDQVLLQASQAMNGGRFHDAVRICQDLLRKAPDNSGALAILGTSLARLGKSAEGLPSLIQAVTLRPTDVAVLIEASICARLAGSHEQAVELGRRAVALQPDNPKARCFLGLALAETVNIEGALLQLQEAARLAPNNPQVLHNLGLVLERSGREAEALEQFRQVVSVAPQAFGSRLAMATLLLKAGNPAAALSQAQLCLGQDASNLSALLLAARASGALSLDKESEGFIDRALAVNPHENAALVMKGFQVQATGDFQAAKAFFEQALAINPIQGAPYWGLRQGPIAGAEELTQVEGIKQVAEELPPGSLERAYAHFAVAKIHADLGMHQAAMAHYDTANGEAAIAQRVHSRYDPQAFPRFLEACQATFTAEFFSKYAELADPSRRPIFIVGMMRSGTTLMEQILSSHPEVTAAGEQYYWPTQAPALIQTGTHQLKADRVKTFKSGYLNSLAAYAQEGMVTDKMPTNAQFIGLIKLLFPNAKIIHMNRDMVDVGLSIYTTPYETSPDFAHVQPHIADACRNHLRLMSFWRSTLPSGSFLDVRYSELVQSSEPVIRTVLKYCDLPWDDACLRHTDNERAISTPSLWQARQPIYSSSLGRWKSYAPYLGDLLSLAELGDGL